MSSALAGYAWVALGGAMGAMARMAVGHWVRSVAGGSLPWHTFFINVSGSFLLGLFATMVGTRASGNVAMLNHLAAVGFLGAYTTFSTFELETYNLVSEGRWPAALGYAAGSVVAGFGGLSLGVLVGRFL